MQFPSVYERDGLELRASARKPGSTVRTLCASRCARERRAAPRRGRSAGRGRTRPNGARRAPSIPLASCHLAYVLRVRAQRDLGVDRRGAADATPGEERDAPPAPPSISAKRIGHQRSCVALASQRVKSAAVRCGPTLEQQHVAAALARARPRRLRRRRRSRPRRRRSARSSDPQVRPVLREPRGERGVEVDLLPRACRVGARVRRSRCRTPRSRARVPTRTRASRTCCAISPARDGGERGERGPRVPLVHPARAARRRRPTGRTRAEPGTIASQTRSTVSAVSSSSTCRPAMRRS